MTLRRTAVAGMRRLRHTLSAAWAAAWFAGIGVLAWVAIDLNGRLQLQDLDAQLALSATATYGLAWFDEDGRFHDEVLRRESDLLDGAVDIWVVEPGAEPLIHLAPAKPKFQFESLVQVAERVVAMETEVVFDGSDARDAPYRVHAIPTYQDGVDDVAKAAIIVVGDPRPALRAHTAFATKLVLLALAIGAVGLALGIALARWSVRPLASALEQRERFLAAAAHELRTPIASLRAVCESALAGDEPAATALERVGALARRTGDVVDELLVFARLDAGQATLEPKPVRLDLLVETCLPEDEGIAFDARESVVDVDARLARVAIRNLIENAVLHSNGGVRVAVFGSSIVVEDDGPGIPAAILDLAQRPFSVVPSHRGGGLGLATAKMIAELHGGALELENRADGGARVTLRLS